MSDPGKRAVLIMNGGSPLKDCPADWKAAEQWEEQANSSSPDNPGCLVAPGCRPPTPTIRAVQSGDFSDPAIWNTSTQEAQ